MIFATSDIIFSVLFMVAVISFSLLVRYLLSRFKAQKATALQTIFNALKEPLQIIFIMTAFYLLLQALAFEWTDDPLIGRIYGLTVMLGLTWLLIAAVHGVSKFALSRFDVSQRDNLAARRIHTQIRVVRSLAVALIIIVAIAAILISFEQIRALGVSLLASAGVAGIILGLAAQKTLGNFFTGLQIAITQPIRIDDAILVEGEWGRIEEINLTYVVVHIWDHRRLILPISYFVEQPFQNWTRKTADLIGAIVLHVDYSMPLQPLRDELDRLLADNPLWDQKVKVIQVVDTTERTMQLRVLVSAADSPSTWDLRCQIREGLIDFIQKNYERHLPRFRTEEKEAMYAE